jgi:hypothetical protein
VTLQVLQDRNNLIRRKGDSRVSFCPPIAENPITVHVIHLLWTFSLGKGICDIGMPEVHTQRDSKSYLQAKVNLLGRGCIRCTMDHGFTTTCGTVTYTSNFLGVVFMGLDRIQPNPIEN